MAVALLGKQRPLALAALLAAVACAGTPHVADALGWTRSIVDSAGDVGEFSSLVLNSGGTPYVAYYDFDRQDLKFAGWTGSSWLTMVVDTTGDVGQYASMAFDATDRPFIAYYDATRADLKFATYSSGFWTIEVVDSTGIVGKQCSLALDPSGIPSVAYYDQTHGDLKVATRYSAFSWNIQTVDATGNVGNYPSLAIDTYGYFHISYLDVTHYDLKYAHGYGFSWTFETIDSPGQVGLTSSLKVDASGVPHVAYFDNTNGALKYASRTGSPWVTEFVDSAGFVGLFSSLALDSFNLPHIAYLYGYVPNADLRYASFDGANWTVTAVDTVQDVGYYPSLVLASDMPRLTYYDNTHYDCIFSEGVPANASCTPVSFWHPGPSIKITSPLRYYLYEGLGLLNRRPGDALAFSIVASDLDYLVQTCTDCEGRTQTRKWGPYADKLAYHWSLRAGSPGQLILPDGPERTAVLYQIPPCDWSPGVERIATIDVDITNDSSAVKVLDPPYTGASATIHMKPVCGPRNKEVGYIEVTINLTPGSTPGDQNVAEGGSGTCIPMPPAWIKGANMTVTTIDTLVSPNLCPRYVMLLSANGSDSDDAVLTCQSDGLACDSNTLPLGTPDPLTYQWSVLSGDGEFPIGSTGRVVPFRPRTTPTLVRCTITDSHTQFTDTAPPQERTLARSPRPRAIVAVGHITSELGDPIEDAQAAADRAVKHYEDAGYEVTYLKGATEDQVKDALMDPCTQAVWLTGHGSPGFVTMEPGTSGQGIGFPNFSTPAYALWHCADGVNPRLLEIAMVGCNTFRKGLLDKLFCGRVYLFDHKLFGGWIGWTLEYSAEQWERDWHRPEPAHDP